MEKILKVGNYLINKDVKTILEDVQSQVTNGKLSSIKVSGSSIGVTCPFHADGHEHRPSCYINIGSDDVPYGWFNCFTCHESGPLEKFIGECFGQSQKFGEQWLVSKYGGSIIKPTLFLPPINLESNIKKENKVLSESVLSTFESYHPYMTKRKLTPEVIKKFEIKYDSKTKCLVFPVRNLSGDISFLTRRSVENKSFIIDSGANKKDIYLLYNIIKEGIRDVFVVESQINALTLWGWGYPAVALFGAGTSKEQMEALNKTNIIHYTLCYDNDPAGRKGAERFKKFINKRSFIDDIIMPNGKDVNDLTKEEFEELLNGK